MEDWIKRDRQTNRVEMKKKEREHELVAMGRERKGEREAGESAR